MRVRPFHPDDTEAVISLWKDCKLTTSHNDPYQDIVRKLQVDPGLFLVGEIDGSVMASVMGGYEGHRGWLNYLAVSPGHQHQGYGRILVEAIERLLAERGAPKKSTSRCEPATGQSSKYIRRSAIRWTMLSAWAKD